MAVPRVGKELLEKIAYQPGLDAVEVVLAVAPKTNQAGHTEQSQMMAHRRLFPLCRDMLGVATNPIPIKAALKLLGRGSGELRLPLWPLDAAGEARVRQTLLAYGLLR